MQYFSTQSHKKWSSYNTQSEEQVKYAHTHIHNFKETNSLGLDVLVT